eukprot:gb/GECG01015868.1/.p1 GENE.gb/GECG01015868.1/~~gb/GECG01015868.1/.p1  ORF type:complete len:166 (+),score=18.68 gb/GECG01015868.1/:1-498(+)
MKLEWVVCSPIHSLLSSTIHVYLCIVNRLLVCTRTDIVNWKMSGIRRRTGGKETNSGTTSSIVQEQVHHESSTNARQQQQQQQRQPQQRSAQVPVAGIPQEEIEKYRGPIGWCRRRTYQYELTTGLYMLDRWEKVLFNTVLMGIFGGLSYYGYQYVDSLIQGYGL